MRRFRPGAALPVLAFVLTACLRQAQDLEEHVKERTLKVNGLDRTFWLHVPPGVSKDRPAPLVFALHGGGTTGRAMIRASGFTALSDAESFVLAYPEGVEKNWNDGRGLEKIRAQKENVDDVAFFAAMIDALVKELGVDRKRVYSTGISNGGFMSERLGAELSDRVAAIAPVASGMAPAVADKFRPKEPVSVLIMNGTEDPLVPYKGGRMGLDRGTTVGTEDIVNKWITADQCTERPLTDLLPDKDPADKCRVERTTYPGGKNGAEVVLFKIEGGGHTWPGGQQYLPERAIGRVCRDIDGPAVIWEFFKKHPKP